MMVPINMAATVRLSAIEDALEMQTGESRSFLNLDTGGVETVSLDLLSAAEDGEDEEPNLPESQDEEWELVKTIVASDRFRRLPTQFDIHEWEIMERFSYSVGSERVRVELLDAIHGCGAFRTFKNAIRRNRIEQDWFSFRADALKEIAKEWCEEHAIVWEYVTALP